MSLSEKVLSKKVLGYRVVLDRRGDVKDKPKLTLSQVAFKKIHTWTRKAVEDAGVECSGLGIVRFRPEYNDYLVENVWLIKPEKIGRADVDMDPMAVTYLMSDLLEKKVDMKKLRFHWHSHADFGVGWSANDDNTCRNVFATGSPWTISLVVNSKGKHLARMDFPLEKKDPIHQIPVFLEVPMWHNTTTEIMEEYEENCGEILRKKREDQIEEIAEEDGGLFDLLEEASSEG
jgi:hypothetical protein